jgi:hypothetical protein
MAEKLQLRRTVIAGETAPDDDSVIENGEIIGRIQRAVERQPQNLSACDH